ncbi:MAG: hypothetical protein II151_05255 [Bacteroidales bacterium]|nr:hypothetical protein [Bacteroidales bacterium]
MKRILEYAGIALILLALAYAYAFPVLQGKRVDQSDISGYIGMSREMAVWDAAHPDDHTQWSGSMFSGMPTASFANTPKGDWTQKYYNVLMSGPSPANWLFIALLGGFLMMLALGVGPLAAAGGAIATAFCSYNFQIILVGHNTKMQAIALAPWVLAAMIFTYKSALRKDTSSWKDWLPNTLLGATLFAFALSFQIKANHQQITYYLAFVVLAYAITLAVSLLTKKQPLKEPLTRFFAASGLLLVLGLTGIATNANKLLPLYEYQEHTMRGGSELTSTENTEVNSEGLSIDYATAWSYGWEELPNLMIANFNGGSSAQSVNPDKSATIALLQSAGQKDARQIAKALPMYWGPQPFTAGPMFMGAISIFLFVLGLLMYRGKEKWWLLAATILAVLMALGYHFMWFTKILFYHLPLYSKFRTVSMALVVLQWTLPALGFLVLEKIMRGNYKKEEILRPALIAYAVTAGFCLLCLLAPGLAGDFSSPTDAGQPDILVDALKSDRMTLLKQDARTSLIFISAAFLLLFWGVGDNSAKAKSKKTIATIGICLLVLLNLWTTGKRYLNNDSFVAKRDFASQFNKRPVDEFILKDTSPSYRVLDLSVDIFNDSHPSYWHKNIGGYSPAKLQSYQDLINLYLVRDINQLASAAGKAGTLDELQASMPSVPWLSALNMKYLILGANIPPAVNDEAYGNAWFVSSVTGAATADEEIKLAGEQDLRTTAVVRNDMQDALKGFTPSPEAGAGTVEMTSYAPNELNYKYSAQAPSLAVFSEIWYPKGWKAWLDGDRSKEINLLRTDWCLRGAVLPAGDHTLTMRYEPEIIRRSEHISRASSIFLTILTLLVAAGMALAKKKEQ